MSSTSNFPNSEKSVISHTKYGSVQGAKIRLTNISVMYTDLSEDKAEYQLLYREFTRKVVILEFTCPGE